MSFPKSGRLFLEAADANAWRTFDVHDCTGPETCGHHTDMDTSGAGQANTVPEDVEEQVQGRERHRETGGEQPRFAGNRPSGISVRCNAHANGDEPDHHHGFCGEPLRATQVGKNGIATFPASDEIDTHRWHPVALPGSSSAAVGFFMHPEAETADGRLGHWNPKASNTKSPRQKLPL